MTTLKDNLYIVHKGKSQRQSLLAPGLDYLAKGRVHSCTSSMLFLVEKLDF